MTLVTVGVPVRNGTKTLARALESLVGQTERSLEILVSDNASTDDTVAIAEAFAAKDDRIRVHRHAENVGITSNFELVLSRARGEYFMWAAHDDVWDPAFVETLRAALDADPGAQAAMCATTRVTEDGKLVDEVRFVGSGDVGRSWLGLALEVAKGSPHHLYICGLFRTEALRALANPLPRVAAADRLFALNLVLSGRLAYRDEPLYRREVSDRPIGERYADEDIGRWWNESWPALRAAATLGPYLLRSPTIPWWKKALTPLLVAVYLERRLPIRAAVRKIVGGRR